VIGSRAAVDRRAARTPRPRAIVGTLGGVTIVAYGVGYYAYGVLLDPIRTSTHWSQAALSLVFSGVLVLGGLGSLAAGRLVDRAGCRPAFVVAAGIGPAGLAGASTVTSLPAFAATYMVGCAAIAAAGFYHVTQPAAMRAAPHAPDTAVVWLTILGAFASPIFLPLTNSLISAVGWRDTLRIQATIVLLVFAIAALAIGRPPEPTVTPARASGRAHAALREAWRDRIFRRWIAASVVSGAAVDIVLLNQVPAMIAAGLSAGTAASIAALRGLIQLAGRFPLSPIVRRLGTQRTIVASLIVAATGTLLLPTTGTIDTALLFSLLAGSSIGALSTLQGLHTHHVVGPRDLSLIMGAQQGVFAIGGAAGPALAGLLLQLTHSYTPTEILTTIGFLVAATVIASTTPPARRGDQRRLRRPSGRSRAPAAAGGRSRAPAAAPTPVHPVGRTARL
jgi:MFS family permease